MLWDNPRPIGYWPGTPNQFREPTVDDCTWYATEFAFEAASETHRSVHPVKGLRNFSSDTVGGTPVSVAIRDSLRLWPKSERVWAEYGAYSRDYLEHLLQRGVTLILGGDYEKLPAHYRRWTNNDTFDHAVACRTYRNRLPGVEQTFLYDPLGGGPTFKPYDGEWITLDALLDDYSWHFAGKIWAGIVENKGDSPMKRVFVHPETPTNKEVTVPRGTIVREAPRTTSEKVKTIWSSTRKFPMIGAASNGWRLIGWDLEVSTGNIGYIHRDDIIGVFDVAIRNNTNYEIDAYRLTIEGLNKTIATQIKRLEAKDQHMENGLQE
jgi:hypothetical protein